MNKTTVDHRNLMLLRINRYVEATRKDPVILRSPFTGEIIFVDGGYHAIGGFVADLVCGQQ